MLKAFIIEPSNKRGTISCSFCGLNYKNREYRILFDNRKIVYFLVEDNKKEIYCHECLCNLQTSKKGNKIKLIDEKGKIYKYYLK